MYVAVKGGEKAILNSYEALSRSRRGSEEVPEITVAQIQEQLRLSVARTMTEGSVYDPELAALAIKQASGDILEAIFLLRAYRTTLPRFGYSQCLDTARMLCERRVSATFKDLPGGQILGPTYDYTQRLLDFSLLQTGRKLTQQQNKPGMQAVEDELPGVLELLNQEGLIENPQSDGATEEPGDLTRDPIQFPIGRDLRLQGLARGDEGFLLGLAYSTQRGYGNTHPFAGEVRYGTVPVVIAPEELGFDIEVGDVEVTECQMVNQFLGSKDKPPQFTRGYGLAFGHSERKAMAMALVDRSLRARELGESTGSPAQQEEFVLSHCDNVEASGFVQHLKLPHYIDFQSELTLVRAMRAEQEEKRRTGND